MLSTKYIGIDVGNEVIADPAGEDRRLHRCHPPLRKGLHPAIQVDSSGGNAAFSVDPAANIFHAIADRPLVNIQANVIPTLHGGASFGVSESARPLSSAFVHQALLLSTYTFKLIKTYL
jgi:hypothetical protein